MVIEHQKLKSRLQKILGKDISGNLSVQSLKINHTSATVELQMSFKEENIPPNFQKKIRNCLIILLDIPDFKLAITRLEPSASTSTVESIKSDGLTFSTGKYRYQIFAETLHISSLVSVNKMELVEEEY